MAVEVEVEVVILNDNQVRIKFPNGESVRISGRNDNGISLVTDGYFTAQRLRPNLMNIQVRGIYEPGGVGDV